MYQTVPVRKTIFDWAFLGTSACLRAAVGLVFPHVCVVANGLAHSAETRGPLRSRALEAPEGTFEAVTKFGRDTKKTQACDDEEHRAKKLSRRGQTTAVYTNLHGNLRTIGG